MRTSILFAALLAAAASPPRNASAEPYARVYFDDQYIHTLGGCIYPPGTQQTLYVVLHDLNMWIWAVEFRVYVPPSGLFVAADELPYNTLAIGNSETGISIAWTEPQNGFEPVLALRIHAFWKCDCWTFYNEGDTDYIKWIRVEPAFVSGNRGVVRWPDFAEIDIGYQPAAVGCPVLATEETTWGRVKALYR